MADRISFVGLDVHKESIVVAVASGGLRGEVREYGRIANTAAALDRLLRKLGVDGMALRFCYEAGPCGYGIQRRAERIEASDEQEEGPLLVRLPGMGEHDFPALCERHRGGSGAEGQSESPGETPVGDPRSKIDPT
jgi:hypothetical protein